MKSAWLYSIIFIGLMIGCADDIVNPSNGNNDLRNIRFTDSIQNDSIFTDNLRILDIKVDEFTLMIRFDYTGGCKIHEIELYSEKTFLESNPVQVRMRLSHNANEDLCDQLIKDTLYFDLKSVRNLYTVQYGSSTGDVLINVYDPQMQLFNPPILFRF